MALRASDTSSTSFLLKNPADRSRLQTWFMRRGIPLLNTKVAGYVSSSTGANPAHLFRPVLDVGLRLERITTA